MQPTSLKHQLNRLWISRHAFYFMLNREIKVRYKQAFFGIAWAILTPSVQALVFAFIFALVFNINSPQVPYLPQVFLGFIFWNFLSNSISSATFALTGNTDLVTKTDLPKEILVFSAVLSRVVDVFAASLVLFIIMLISGLYISPASLLIVSLIFMVEIFLALGLSLMFASVNVFFRDITAVVPLLLMLWLFLTPVIYPLSSIPSDYYFYAQFNPMVGIIENIKNTLLFHQPLQLPSLIIASSLSLALFVIGITIFKKLEPHFADTI